MSCMSSVRYFKANLIIEVNCYIYVILFDNMKGCTQQQCNKIINVYYQNQNLIR